MILAYCVFGPSDFKDSVILTDYVFGQSVVKDSVILPYVLCIWTE